MTENEALEHAKELYKEHVLFAEEKPDFANRSKKLAEYLEVVIDVLNGRTPEADINDTLGSFIESLEHVKKMYSWCIETDVDAKRTQEYKFYIDWYSCCISALLNYIKGVTKNDGYKTA